jgi:hypothetical protein
MDWSTLLVKLPDALPTLLGTLVGGSLAMASAVLAQRLSHGYTRRRDAERLRYEKAEELIEALFAQADWLIAAYNSLPEETPTLPLSPPNRIHTLQKLHFPELKEPALELNQAFVPWLELFNTQRRAQWRDYQAWRKTYDLTLFDPLYQDYRKAWTKVLDAAVAAAVSLSPRLRLVYRHSQTEKTR